MMTLFGCHILNAGERAENNFNQWLVHSKNSPPVLDRSSLGVYILNLLRQFTLIKFVFLIIWPATANAVFYHVIMLLLFISECTRSF